MNPKNTMKIAVAQQSEIDAIIKTSSQKRYGSGMRLGLSVHIKTDLMH